MSRDLELGTKKVVTVGSNLLKTGIVNVLSPGTRVQLPDIPCQEVTVIAKRTNTGFIYSGDNTVSSTSYGVEHAAKDSYTYAVENANMVYIDASVAGEGVSYVAL